MIRRTALGLVVVAAGGVLMAQSAPPGATPPNPYATSFGAIVPAQMLQKHVRR